MVAAFMAHPFVAGAVTTGTGAGAGAAVAASEGGASGHVVIIVALITTVGGIISGLIARVPAGTQNLQRENEQLRRELAEAQGDRDNGDTHR